VITNDDDDDKRNGGRDLVEPEFTYNASIFGRCKYIKQGKNRLTRLVQEYYAGRAKYSLQKEATLIKHSI
jgi:hypothetical protein